MQQRNGQDAPNEFVLRHPACDQDHNCRSVECSCDILLVTLISSCYNTDTQHTRKNLAMNGKSRKSTRTHSVSHSPLHWCYPQGNQAIQQFDGGIPAVTSHEQPQPLVLTILSILSGVSSEVIATSMKLSRTKCKGKNRRAEETCPHQKPQCGESSRRHGLL